MKRKTLTTAILAGLTGVAGMMGSANAVNVNPEGLGQVLIYPYYTARGGNDTLISVVNTSSEGKAAKVRFLEAVNSREVLDFNLYLSAFDVWTAAITVDGEGAKLVTRDRTCTVPYIFGDFGGEQPLLNFEFTGRNVDGATTAEEREASGYLEVIEMGRLFGDRLETTSSGQFAGFSDRHVTGNPNKLDADGDPGNGLAPPLDNSGRTILSFTGSEWAATHIDLFDQNGDPVLDAAGRQVRAPRDCGQLVTAWTVNARGSYWISDEDTDLQAPAGGQLFGAASIINVNEGTLFSYEAVALDNWTDAIAHTTPGRTTPTIVNGSSFSSAVFQSQGANVDTQVWTSNAQAVNAVLMHEKMANEYVINDALKARTEWVFTMPTKRFHVDPLVAELNIVPVTNGSGQLLDANGTVIRDGLTRIVVLSGGNGTTTVEWQNFLPDSNGIFVGFDGLTAAEVQATFERFEFDGEALPPFGKVFSGSSCEPIKFVEYDREELTPTETTGTIPPIVSPPPPSPPSSISTFDLCYEVSTVRFAEENEPVPTETEILGEPRFTTLPLSNRFPAGWAEFSFNQSVIPGVPGSTSPRDNPLDFPAGARELFNEDSGATYLGLPVIGFAVTTFSNGTLETPDGQTVLSNYGGLFNHRGTRTIENR